MILAETQIQAEPRLATGEFATAFSPLELAIINGLFRGKNTEQVGADLGYSDGAIRNLLSWKDAGEALYAKIARLSGWRPQQWPQAALWLYREGCLEPVTFLAGGPHGLFSKAEITIMSWYWAGVTATTRLAELTGYAPITVVNKVRSSQEPTVFTRLGMLTGRRPRRMVHAARTMVAYGYVPENIVGSRLPDRQPIC